MPEKEIPLYNLLTLLSADQLQLVQHMHAYPNLNMSSCLISHLELHPTHELHAAILTGWSWNEKHVCLKFLSVPAACKGAGLK